MVRRQNPKLLVFLLVHAAVCFYIGRLLCNVSIGESHQYLQGIPQQVFGRNALNETPQKNVKTKNNSTTTPMSQEAIQMKSTKKKSQLRQNETPLHSSGQNLAKNATRKFLKCEDGLLMPNGRTDPMRWQPVNDIKVFVYSAYYDSRPAAGGPIIRVLALGLQTDRPTGRDIYCQLWYQNKKQPVVTTAEYIPMFPRRVNFPDMYFSHFILCKLPSNMTLPLVASVGVQPCAIPTNSLKILNRNSVAESKKRGHALCLPVLYSFKPELLTSLVELVEIHRILGVERITMYFHPDVLKTVELRRFLEYYHKNTGFVVPFTWEIPPELKVNYYAQRAHINDCFYRNMNEFNFVTMSDMDEVLVPRAAWSLPELMKMIDRPNRGSFSFQHFNFVQSNDTSTYPYLVTQTKLRRTDVSLPAKNVRRKTMYKSTKAVKLEVHFGYELVPGAEDYVLDPSEGMLHHYRNILTYDIPKSSELRFVKDTYMTKWGQGLNYTVSKVLSIIT